LAAPTICVGSKAVIAGASANYDAKALRIGGCATSNLARNSGRLDAITNSKGSVDSGNAKGKDALGENRNILAFDRHITFESFLRIAANVFAVFIIKSGFLENEAKRNIARNGGLNLASSRWALIPADTIVIGFAKIAIAGEADRIKV
jgi:hypothetical protein